MGFVVWLTVGLVLLSVSFASAKPTQKEIEAFSKRFKNIDATKFFALKEKMKTRALKEQSAAGTKRIRAPTPRSDERPYTDEIIVANNKSNLLGMLFEGDLVLTNAQIDALTASLDGSRSKRQAINKVNYPGLLWPNRTVYYQIASNYDPTYRELFKKAVAFWSDSTCLRFQESSTAQNRLNVHHGDGCYTYLGMDGGFQDLSLDLGCPRSAKHELGHALGLLHEQSRHDRDNHVTVQWQNIGWSPEQFAKYSPFVNDNYGVPYDYNSMMHYPAGGSGVGDDTLVAQDPNYRFAMGNRRGTFFDLLDINKLYGCEDVCAGKCNTKCNNGGFPNPKDCSVCVCPSGFTQPFCDFPSGPADPEVSGSFIALSPWNGKDYTPSQTFQVPPGYKVKLVITKIGPSNGCELGCNDYGTEVKWRADPRESGYRFCCASDINKTIVSEGPFMVVSHYIYASGKLEYGAKYNFVPDSTPSGLY